MTITIELRDDVAQRLNAEAKRRNTTLEELVALQAEQSLKPAPEFEQIARDIIRDNAELYQRLA